MTYSIISCEKDFTQVGSAIVDNNSFKTKEIIFDVEFNQQNIDSVLTGNIEIGNLGEYLFGVYQKPNSKKIEAGFVSQLKIPSNLKISDKTLKKDEKLSVTHLDEIILKIPIKATLKGKKETIITNSNGEKKTIKIPDYKIDSLLGNPEIDFSINIYRNGTYLSSLNLNDPSKKRVYLSNETFIKEGEKLNINSVINFKNIKNDTIFNFNRQLSNGDIYKSSIKVLDKTRKNAYPFIAIKLNKKILKTELFDKFSDSELSTQSLFNEYFKGIIVEVTSTSKGGALIPLNFSSNLTMPSIDFITTTTIIDKNGIPVKNEKGEIKKIENINSFYLYGIKSSIYKMSESSKLPNNTIIQGTAGSNAVIKILDKDTDNNGKTDLQELLKKNIIVNDASLIFDINKSSVKNIPQRLFLFKTNNITNKNSYIIDYMRDKKTFGGQINYVNNIPDNYTFNLTNYITQIIKGNENNSKLNLRVYNKYYEISKNNSSIKFYNWDPRSVILLNSSTKNGTKRGVKLKIIYTEEK